MEVHHTLPGGQSEALLSFPLWEIWKAELLLHEDCDVHMALSRVTTLAYHLHWPWRYYRIWASVFSSTKWEDSCSTWLRTAMRMKWGGCWAPHNHLVSALCYIGSVLHSSWSLALKATVVSAMHNFLKNWVSTSKEGLGCLGCSSCCGAREKEGLEVPKP
jgi:hypothetical protein